MMPDAEQIGAAYAWIEQEGSIHLKAVTRDGDPLELSAEEARKLAQALLVLAAELESIDERQGGAP